MNHIYQIQVRGHLTDEWSDWFAGLRIHRLDPNDTLLVGKLDQTALHGILARIRDLNLVLIAVNPIDADTATNEGYQLEQGGICVPDG